MIIRVSLVIFTSQTYSNMKDRTTTIDSDTNDHENVHPWLSSEGSVCQVLGSRRRREAEAVRTRQEGRGGQLTRPL